MDFTSEETLTNCKVFSPREQGVSCPVYYFFGKHDENNLDYYYVLNYPPQYTSFRVAFNKSYPSRELPKRIFLLAHKVEDKPKWWKDEGSYTAMYAHVCKGSVDLLNTPDFDIWVSYSDDVHIIYGKQFIDERWIGIFNSIFDELKEAKYSDQLKLKIEGIYYAELKYLKYNTSIPRAYREVMITYISEALDCMVSKN